MSESSQAARCPVPSRARELVAGEEFEYSDAFAVVVPDAARLSAEGWARAMFTPRSFADWLFGAAWAAATGVRPPAAGRRMGVFGLVTPDAAATVLVGDSPRYRIRLVVLADRGRVTLVTFVKSRRPVWRQLMKPVLAAHRRVAPRLVDRGVMRSARPAGASG